MDVKDIINLMATLSIGLDQPSDSDIAVFLTYLNLAYFELLQENLSQNPEIPIVTETLTCTNGVLGPTQYKPFIISVIWDSNSNVSLKGANRDSIQRFDPSLTTKGNPQQWFYSGGQINIYPIFSGQIGIRYYSQPSALKLISVSDEILVPKIFQQILVDGAAYYIFQSETGFKDGQKMADAKLRWETGRSKLFNYLKNLGGQYAYSTYSSV